MTALLGALHSAVGDASDVRTRALDRHVYAADASHFLLTPEAVVIARDTATVGRLMRTTAELGVPLTFRAGGTSLSGQGLTDGVLVDVRAGFRDIEILDGGLRVRVQPGLTLRQVNARLAPYGRRLGPDPASEAACTIGGIVANNSSGMACGTLENCYRTVDSLVLVLPSGTVVDTSAPDGDERLRVAEPRLHSGLLLLRDRVRGNATSLATVRQQFAMKNTMGYGINSYVDHDTASQILTHLVIGSEGTLGFVAEATFRTVPLRRHVATGLAVFASLAEANEALPALVSTRASVIELMDATSLRVGQELGPAKEVPPQVAALDVANHAALLVEYHAESTAALMHQVGEAGPLLGGLPVTAPVELDEDPRRRASLWKLRKGLYAAVAGARPSGTTALLEDVVVPVDSLADTCESLRALFDDHAYRDSVIFGHAKDGNIHFMLTDRFDTPASLDRYHHFTEAMVDLVLGHGGSLKAEHGTGRMMAPYVRRQYGDELYDVMVQTKRLIDPSGLLNPGVIINEDAMVHLQHLKLQPEVEPEVDKCVECGFCEPVCPSRDLTLTPRQRIVARRASETARRQGDEALVAELDQAYEYDGLETCAADGMCQTACPVHINTGDLVRRLRHDSRGWAESAVWTAAAKHWSGTTRAASIALGAAALAPSRAATAATDVGRSLFGADAVPRWTPDLPAGGRRRAGTAPEGADALYLPACVGSLFEPAGTGVQVSLERLCDRVGLRLAVPPEIDSLCCGTPWSSKGFSRGYEEMRSRVGRAVAQSGYFSVVSDATSCTEGFAKLLSDIPGVQVQDAVAFVADRVLGGLPRAHKLKSLVLHPTCSSIQVGIDDALLRIGHAVADTLHIPVDWGCCGFAGDRGMLHPELTAAATAAEAQEVRAMGAVGHASCNRTCELGMTRATGRPYYHLLELLEQVTRPGEPARS